MLEKLYNLDQETTVDGVKYQISPLTMTNIASIVAIESRLLNLFADENPDVADTLTIIASEFPNVVNMIINTSVKVLDPKNEKKGFQEIPVELAERMPSGITHKLLEKVIEASKIDVDALKKSFQNLQKLWVKQNS